MFIIVLVLVVIGLLFIYKGAENEQEQQEGFFHSLFGTFLVIVPVGAELIITSSMLWVVLTVAAVMPSVIAAQVLGVRSGRRASSRLASLRIVGSSIKWPERPNR